METQELTNRMNNDFKEFQSNGNTHVLVDNVFIYFDALKKDIATDNQNLETQHFFTKLNHERELKFCKQKINPE